MNIPVMTYRSVAMSKAGDRSGSLDYPLLLVTAALLGIGLVMVGSSSVSIAEQQYGDSFHYLWRQLAYLVVGFGAALIVLKIPLRIWQELGPGMIMLSMLLLALVFIPGLGRTVNGSTRWLNTAGFNLQPSELVKLFTLVYLSGYLVRHHAAVQTTAGGFLRPLLLMSILVALLLLEPDYGAAAVLLMSAMGLMWLAGVRFLQFFLLLGAAAAVLAVLAEELGLFGVLIVIGLFAFLVFRILHIARQAELRDRPFAAYLAYGIGLWIALQVVINLGVNMGILPTKGLTLPFMSYGGSSLMVMMVAIAILLRIDYETHQDDRPSQRRGRQAA